MEKLKEKAIMGRPKGSVNKSLWKELPKEQLNNFLETHNYKQATDGKDNFYGFYIGIDSILKVVEKDSATYRYKIVKFNDIKTHNNAGYITYNFGKYRTIHRMLAMTHLPGYKKGLVVDHINGVKTDNRLENLRWVTQSENAKAAWDNGLIKPATERNVQYSWIGQYLILNHDRQNIIPMTPDEYIDWRKEHDMPISTNIRNRYKMYLAE